MATYTSTTTPYCSAAQMLARVDVRTIAKLMSDDPAVVPTYAELVDTSSRAGGYLNTILLDASADVEMACLRGGRYTVADLQGLTGAQASGLARLVCDLAIVKCYQRRPAPDMPLPSQTQQAMGKLLALETGELVFGIQEAIDASHLQHATDQPPDVVERNGIVVQAQEYFGRRSNRNLPRRA